MSRAESSKRLSDKQVRARIKRLIDGGRLDELATGRGARSANHQFFNANRDLMKTLVERGLSFSKMVTFLREVDPDRFAKLSVSTVRDWLRSEPEFKSLLDSRIGKEATTTPPSLGPTNVTSAPSLTIPVGVAPTELPAFPKRESR